MLWNEQIELGTWDTDVIVQWLITEAGPGALPGVLQRVWVQSLDQGSVLGKTTATRTLCASSIL